MDHEWPSKEILGTLDRWRPTSRSPRPTTTVPAPSCSRSSTSAAREPRPRRPGRRAIGSYETGDQALIYLFGPVTLALILLITRRCRRLPCADTRVGHGW